MRVSKGDNRKIRLKVVARKSIENEFMQYTSMYLH